MCTGEQRDPPDCRQPEAFAQCLHHAQIRVFLDEAGSAVCIYVVREINVCLVDDDNAGEALVLEQSTDGRYGDERARRVSGGAEEDETDTWVSVDGFLDLRKVIRYNCITETRRPPRQCQR